MLFLQFWYTYSVMQESILYKKLKNNFVQCETCNHTCVIMPGKRGVCGVRENISGKLYVLNYAKIIAAHIDPIEKKPLNDFLPGTWTYSIACNGCNFKCLHCQNSEISQAKNISGQELLPEKIIENTIKFNCPSISYTYTEPTIFLEYALDTMKLARKNNIKNIWVSNGYFSDKTLKLILPYLDAINIDLKSFSEKFYSEICKAKLKPVLDNLIKIYKAGIHLEITTLIIPSKNDSSKELKKLTEFIYKKLGPEVPWHVTSFYPYYKMKNLLPTSKEQIKKAVEIGERVGLKKIYYK